MLSLVVFLAFSANAISSSSVSFKPLKNFCQQLGGEHNCNLLPQKTPPKTVIVIHGMNSSMGLGTGSDDYSNYVRLLSFLTDLGKNNAKYHVYGIDFNSNGALSGDQAVRLVALSYSATCDAQHHWQDCWRIVEESVKKYNPYTITIRDVSQEISQLLIKAVTEGRIEKANYTKDGHLLNPISIISHSMGGLIARDLLYVGENDITGYEFLLQHGVWINEYISLGAPHNHGFFGINNAKLKALVDTADCAQLQPIFEKTSFVAYQYCEAEHWIKVINEENNHWLNGQAISISKVDFPQIHWVFVSGVGKRLFIDQAIGDGIVDWQSAQFQLFSGDATPRADNRVYLNEYLDTGNFLPFLDNNIHVNPVPGQRGAVAPDGGVLPFSGFPEYSNVDHSSMINVGYYYGGDIKNNDHLMKCSSTAKLDNGIAACIGYFQYIIPATTLCNLPGYNAKLPYFKNNPQFFPSSGIANFAKKCEVRL